ncbi:MAG: VUT family protein [Parasporobacterium sp.]|nr:VUT family protein [Parasporobacterium sp.]
MKFKNIIKEMLVLQRNIPGIVFALFVMSVVSMNLLANKSIDLHVSWLALDCGIIFSWLTFLIMDMIARHYGPRAATLLSVEALVISVFFILMLFAGSRIPGVWGESYSFENSSDINAALDNTFGGTWYVVLGSAIAFLVSSLVNNSLNWLIGKKIKKKGFGEFALRSYISTFVSQFVDNLCFALIVSLNFFGWSLLQCLMCAVTGAVVELLCEVIFSPIGFRVSQKWMKNNTGREYLVTYAAKYSCGSIS